MGRPCPARGGFCSCLLVCSFWSNYPTAVGLPLRWPPPLRVDGVFLIPLTQDERSCYGSQSASLLSPRWHQRRRRRFPLGLWRLVGTRVTVAGERGARGAHAGRGGLGRATGAEQQRRLLAAARPAAGRLTRGRAAAPPPLPPSCHFVSRADTGRERWFLFPFSLPWLRIKYPWPAGCLGLGFGIFLVETRVPKAPRFISRPAPIRVKRVAAAGMEQPLPQGLPPTAFPGPGAAPGLASTGPSSEFHYCCIFT